MCGIAGFISSNSGPEAEIILRSMADRLRHRGPDSQNIHIIPLKNGDVLGFAHTLLSIIGRPGEGLQPFQTSGGTLIFNGAIYNFQELGKRLQEKSVFLKTTTDTEVFAQGLTTQGLNFLNEVRGMYAFAFWDKHKNKLYIGRDNYGVKPIYLYQKGGTLAFASEYKALLPHLPNLNIDSGAVNDYLRLRYTPGESTLFKEIKKVAPGCVYEFDPEFKTMQIAFRNQVSKSSTYLSDDDYFALIKQAIDRRAVADVEVGALLSGGIDSGIVCDLLQRSTQTLHTYTLEVGDVSASEVEKAQMVANRIGATNVVIPSLVPDLATLSDLIYHLDDPYGDPIVLALNRIFSFIKGNQRVVVTGEGADEIFSGYVHHRALYLLKWFPHVFLKAGAWSSEILPTSLLKSILPYAGKLDDSDYQTAISRVGQYARTPSLGSFQKIFNLFDDADLRESGPTYLSPNFDRAADIENLRDSDFRQWLPDSQLFKLDKIAMASSIEAREPFVDVDLIQSMSGVPASMHFGLRTDKRLMRRVLEGRSRIGSEITRSRKTSFFQPFDLKSAGPLSRMLLTLLNDSNGLARAALTTGEFLRLTTKSKTGSLLDQKKIFALSCLDIWESRIRSLCSTGLQLE